MRELINNLLNKNYAKVIEDEELVSHILRYICILISGYLENELNTIIENYKSKEHFKNHECKKFINSQRKIQNAKWCSIRPIFLNIDDNLLINFKSKVNNDFDKIVYSIDSIVKIRHKIAHGETNITELSQEDLKSHFSNINLFLNILNEIFDELE